MVSSAPCECETRWPCLVEVTGRTSGNLEHNLAEILAAAYQFIAVDHFFRSENVADDRVEFPVGNPAGELLPGLLHQGLLAREIGEPESLHAGGFGVERAQIELRMLAGGGAVLNDLAEIAQTANAFPGVLAAEHLENRVHALASRQVANCIFIIVLRVVDRVLQAKFFHAR